MKEIKLFEKGILKNPGDEARAYISKTNRKVATIHTGNIKMSRVEYANGTVVETKAIRSR